MANPFLMTDDDLEQDNEPVCNPFLMQAADDEDDAPPADSADNPFFADAKNPFADFGGGGGDDAPDAQPPHEDHAANIFGTADEAIVPMSSAGDANDDNGDGKAAADIDSAMSFFGTTISDEDDEHDPMDHQHQPVAKPIALNIPSAHDDGASDDEVNSHMMPPVRPVPPSRTTQDLILSVSDQLDQTSSHLLDRIPVTRTPSPVSMRDLHTPSPTGDLLDVSDGGNVFGDDVASAAQLPHDIFGTGAVGNDNPFASVMDVEPQPIVKPEPPRPPPPRPTPPRPSPPRRPSPPQMPAAAVTPPKAPPSRPAPPPSAATAAAEPDLFDMFGSSDIPPQPKKPPPPKSNQDIMSLFSVDKTAATAAAAAPATNDLLSGDILSMDNDADFSPSSAAVMTSAPPPQGGGGGGFMEAAKHPPPPPPTRPAPPAAPAAPAHEEIRSSADASDADIADNVSSVSPVISDMQTTHPETTPPVEKENNILDDADTLSPSGVSAVESMASDYQQQQQPPQQYYDEQYSAIVPPVVEDAIAHDERMDTTVDFGHVTPTPSVNPFASPETEPVEMVAVTAAALPAVELSFSVEPPAAAAADEFDAFAAKFDSVKKEDNNLLDGFGPPSRSVSSEFAWGNEESAAAAFGDDSSTGASAVAANGFGGDDEDGFDSFLAMAAPPAVARSDSRDSDDGDTPGREFNVVIRPRDVDLAAPAAGSALAPPPPRGSQNNSMYSGDSSPRVNPFDKSGDDAAAAGATPPVSFPAELDTAMPGAAGASAHMQRTDSAETPPTPLFDEDVSQPLEDFPRVTYVGDGWEMQLRQPNKKKITGQRFWKKIWLRVVNPHENPVIQLRNAPTDKEPFQELPLQACYSISDISAQQFDQFGKIFTVKLQYIFYKERPGVRPGQVTKAERLTTKLSQFAAYAIQGDYQGVKEFGSDLKKLGLPVEHAPQVSQLFKIGSHNYEDVKQFMVYVDELLFKYNVHRDRALTYKMEEVQVTAVDELYVEQTAEGQVMKQICRVRLFFLGFLSGMPTIELGVNDLWRQGKEVVGRHDIIPVVTEEWIRLEGVEFHSCVQQNEYERSRTIRFQPPDACYIELMRFRVRPPKNRELPFQLKAVWCVTGNKVELRADVLVPGFASRKLGQIPCEDVSIRFPIPECWIYLFRVEKHFRYGSVKSAHRRTGKIKGIERILGTVDQLQESLIEVTSGQAKYEHHHRAIVWRCPRLPKEGQGAYTTHQLVVRMALTSYDQIPEQLAPFCYVEFTMPATQVSHMTVRSVSVQDSDSDDPPEKYVRYLARHEYRVGIEHTTGDSLNPYLAATAARKPEPVKEEAPAPSMPAIAGSDSDSDSN